MVIHTGSLYLVTGLETKEELGGAWEEVARWSVGVDDSRGVFSVW